MYRIGFEPASTGFHSHRSRSTELQVESSIRGNSSMIYVIMENVLICTVCDVVIFIYSTGSKSLPNYIFVRPKLIVDAKYPKITYIKLFTFNLFVTKKCLNKQLAYLQYHYKTASDMLHVVAHPRARENMYVDLGSRMICFESRQYDGIIKFIRRVWCGKFYRDDDGYMQMTVQRQVLSQSIVTKPLFFKHVVTKAFEIL